MKPHAPMLRMLPLALFLAAAPAASSEASYRPVVGEPHPDFALRSIDDGRTVSLSDFRGKKVLLIHFASW